MALLAGNLQSKLLLLMVSLKKPHFVARYSTNSSSSPSRYVPQNPSSICSISQHHQVKDPTLTKKSIQPSELIEPEEEEEDHLSYDSNICRKNEEDAKKAAVAAIADRAITAVELENKLVAKGFAPNVIQRVLGAMQANGYINDYSYAESYTHSRWASSTWGPKRIMQALHRKGVSEADAKKATQHVFQGDDDGPCVLGMSKTSVDRLLVQASKQWMRSQSVTHDKRKARLIRWLQYRGFSWPIINFVLKRLESHSTP